MSLNEEDVLAAIPRGVVFPWISSGKPPKGWAICDGTNGTPDLQGRFLMGATAQFSVGMFGGALKHGHKVTKDGVGNGNGFSIDGRCNLGDAIENEHIPPFYAVNYIVKL